MPTGEFSEIRAEQAPEFRFASWAVLRPYALGLYFIALVLWTATYGIPVQRELVILWTCGALACVSIGRPPREILQLVVDWLPIVAVLWAYDLTRGAADSWGIGVHVHTMIDFDSFVFGGETPTEWLQDRLYEPGVVHWYDVLFTFVYTSYFIVPFAVAGWFWARDRRAFHRFTRRLVTLALAGLATYILFPAAPPWMAGEMGLIDEVHRTTGKGWEVVSVGTASLFSKGQAGSNLVAAVPSLHTAMVTLVALFLWSRVRRRWLRPLLLLYPLLMGLTLMATGEHYFFDVLLGWIYAGAVMGAWSWWEWRQEAKLPASDAALALRAESPSA
ncbi:MAG TPA: phosphatase PAP2 family protein [Solirubrobacterales bacterium]|jgi:membrane-associated phospholipid phosphatase|nr:phosphatase PAP2 family protein [Solirubrobacterales bacterium]